MEELTEEVITDEPETVITDQEEQQESNEQQEEIPSGPQQVEVINTIETKWPAGIEGIDYETYTGNNIALTVRKEITYGDVLVSSLLAFLIAFMIIKFFHELLLGGKK